MAWITSHNGYVEMTFSHIKYNIETDLRDNIKVLLPSCYQLRNILLFGIQLTFVMSRVW